MSSSCEFNDVYDFVENFGQMNYENPVLDAKSSIVHWCVRWTEHPQAVLILDGLWRSYEEARAADLPTLGGQSRMNYLVGHFYPLMDRLTGSYGPLRACTPERCAGSTKLGDALDPENLISAPAAQKDYNPYADEME